MVLVKWRAAVGLLATLVRAMSSGGEIYAAGPGPFHLSNSTIGSRTDGWQSTSCPTFLHVLDLKGD